MPSGGHLGGGVLGLRGLHGARAAPHRPDLHRTVRLEVGKGAQSHRRERQHDDVHVRRPGPPRLDQQPAAGGCRDVRVPPERGGVRLCHRPARRRVQRRPDRDRAVRGRHRPHHAAEARRAGGEHPGRRGRRPGRECRGRVRHVRARGRGLPADVRHGRPDDLRDGDVPGVDEDDLRVQPARPGDEADPARRPARRARDDVDVRLRRRATRRGAGVGDEGGEHGSSRTRDHHVHGHPRQRAADGRPAVEPDDAGPVGPAGPQDGEVRLLAARRAAGGRGRRRQRDHAHVRRRGQQADDRHPRRRPARDVVRHRGQGDQGGLAPCARRAWRRPTTTSCRTS